MSIIRSNKTDNTNVGLLHSKQTIPTLGGKVQNSSVITATVDEIRPTGDVILSTAQGLLRGSSSLTLEAGDKVSVRITKDQDGNVNAHIISKHTSNETLSKLDTMGIEILHKYITQNTEDASNFIKAPEALRARLSYVSGARNIIKYGHLKPSDEISIRLSSGKNIPKNIEVIPGEILSNSHETVIIQSPIGIINVNAKSNLEIGDKVMFEVLEAPNITQRHEIKEAITSLFKALDLNRTLLDRIASELENLGQEDSDLRIKQLISTHKYNSMTLTKLFYSAREVPENDVDRWIEQEIVEPFESSPRASDFHILTKSLSQLTNMLSRLGIVGNLSQFYTTQINIPGHHEKKANLKLQQEEGQITFHVDTDHEEYGKISILGRFLPPTSTSLIPSLSLSVRVSKSFPHELQTVLSQNFITHKALFGMEGDIVFENLNI